jgi:hypothetical protein
MTLGRFGSDRRWTFGRLLTVMLLMQAVVHVLLMPSTTFATAGMQSMNMAGAHGLSATAGESGVAGHALGPSMLVAHLAAALVVAALLRHGEGACFALVCLTGASLLALTALARGAASARGPFIEPALPRVGDGASTDQALRLHIVALAQVVRRGPPVAACS